ncbi:MAG: hypothetical protein B6U75_02770 [Desulfurococcales archaeon ex4484_217_1]|nr:MAG: hypothetical protein B6U75_02770 [Desulfurococcales archaeon ex4484_217_1]
MSKKELEREVLKILKEKGELTFEELTAHMRIDKLLLREVIASMIREGIVLKVPDFERGKFMYRPA